MLSSGVYVKGNGPAIVFLHSSLSSAKQWGALIKQLKQDYTCINIDILGYGEAEPVFDEENYSFEQELDRIRHNISLLIGDNPYHLIGHSCGGAIALKLAVEAPTKVLSLSLHEPVAFHLLPQGSKWRNQSDSFARSVYIDDDFEAARLFTNFWNNKGFYDGLPHKLQKVMANDMAKVRLDFKGLMAESYGLDDVAKLSCRAKISLGEDSPQLSRHLAELICKSLPNALLVLTAGGHMSPVSHTEQWVEQQIAFMRQNVPVLTN